MYVCVHTGCWCMHSWHCTCVQGLWNAWINPSQTKNVVVLSSVGGSLLSQTVAIPYMTHTLVKNGQTKICIYYLRTWPQCCHTAVGSHGNKSDSLVRYLVVSVHTLKVRINSSRFFCSLHGWLKFSWEERGDIITVRCQRLPFLIHKHGFDKTKVIIYFDHCGNAGLR